ncbi:A/G-specific adenine glycosylase [Sporosarcina sp. BI001-red]|uniref:A/G-specific adenine glycosylase n=1 Tax=Sporosarcina sp. BI001-red TaxID=2282866 RepID=UPI000E22A9E6|nr:A/G-specific adenine glycosylase [Sporosarcina sp. BI001-red]REB05314.1 A/G-specific adenine glycosylase [Sporosarcina sp. BI001-red]
MKISQKEEFNERLLFWYHQEKRDLPWRRTSNPYYIWVSEVMLQQTRVDTVIPYYERFIASFPTMESLAQAEEERVLKHWEGLGYYSRVRNLQAGVKEVVENYDSKIPQTRAEILNLRGIGPYTAGAVLSIAYGVPEHAVDGNVMRVFSRLFLIEEDIAIPKTKKVFEQRVMEVIDETDPSSFNQAIMELGATICTPKPRCLLCPVRDFCKAFEEGKQEQLPIKTKKVKKKVLTIHSYAISEPGGKWLLRKRPTDGLLGDFWEFPQIELTQEMDSKDALKIDTGLLIEQGEPYAQFNHIFSHVTWNVEGFHAVLQHESPIPEGYRFFSDEELELIPQSKPMSKLLEQLKK